MDQSVQLLDSRGLRAKSGFGQLRPADSAIRIQNARAEVTQHFLVDGLTRLHQFMSNGISLDDMSAQLGEYFGNCRLAARDATGQANFQQRRLLEEFTTQTRRKQLMIVDC